MLSEHNRANRINMLVEDTTLATLLSQDSLVDDARMPGPLSEAGIGRRDRIDHMAVT